MIYLDEIKRIHFVGVLGASMSGLAEISLHLKKTVSGSDLVYNPRLNHLKRIGIDAYVGSDVSRVDWCDLVVYTSAVPDTDVELGYARSIRKPTMERAEYLGLVSEKFKRVIAVSGTHGKSTVTAMLGAIFARSKATVHVGGELIGSESGVVIGGKRYFITEACEYRESFLHLRPDVGLILNIESDHPDYYRSMVELRGAFRKFADRIKPDGALIRYENSGISSRCDAYTVGVHAQATEMRREKGLYSFHPVILNERWRERVHLKVPGAHNVYNALFAILAATVEGIDRRTIVNALDSFEGIKRRYETTMTINGARVISDYAHHPTEIRAVLRVAREQTEGKLTVFFQPHTYSRSEKYFDRFIESLMLADKVVFVKEFPARETPDMGKSAYDMYLSAKKRYDCIYSDLEHAAVLMRELAYTGDLILVLGAGDVDKIARPKPACHRSSTSCSGSSTTTSGKPV